MAAISGSDAPGAALPEARPGGEVLLLALGAALMLWPALLNGFPLIFSDTGTYISQAMEFHLGWDRPPFYSFAVLALGWGRSLWPVVAGQCLLAAAMIRGIQRVVAPGWGRGGVALLLAGLAAGSSLSWTAAKVIPDIFTPLMVLGFAWLVLAPEGAGAGMRGFAAAVIGLAILVHLSNLPLYAGLCLAVLPWRVLRGMRVRWAALLLPLAIGTAGLSGVNAIASGRVSPAPYGATFVLARLLQNGPARRTLARDCATARWALCRDVAAIPATADGFLWDADSPLYREGGPKRLIGQTDAIVRRTVLAEPGAVLRGGARDFLRQLAMFAPGSGLRPWRATAGRTIRRDLPAATYRHFAASRQGRGRLVLPGVVAALDRVLAVAGLALTAGFALVRGAGIGGARRWGTTLGPFCWIVLLALAGNAALTGALSGPHERYQSRVVWLAVLAGAFVAARLYAEWRSRPISSTT